MDWKLGVGQIWYSFNDYINFSDKVGWEKWWGKKWICIDIGDYDNLGYDDFIMLLVFLLDLKIELKEVLGLLNFYSYKLDIVVKVILGYMLCDYLIYWLSQWVCDYGIDGFCVDIVKYVEMDVWQQLKIQVIVVLVEWKKVNLDKVLDVVLFWMIGEVWGYGVMQSDYYCYGFDVMINFDYQDQVVKVVICMVNIDFIWQ